METSENLSFSDVFRGYRKTLVEWIGLIITMEISKWIYYQPQWERSKNKHLWRFTDIMLIETSCLYADRDIIQMLLAVALIHISIFILRQFLYLLHLCPYLHLDNFYCICVICFSFSSPFSLRLKLQSYKLKKHWNVAYVFQKYPENFAFQLFIILK